MLKSRFRKQQRSVALHPSARRNRALDIDAVDLGDFQIAKRRADGQPCHFRVVENRARLEESKALTFRDVFAEVAVQQVGDGRGFAGILAAGQWIRFAIADCGQFPPRPFAGFGERDFGAPRKGRPAFAPVDAIRQDECPLAA